MNILEKDYIALFEAEEPCCFGPIPGPGVYGVFVSDTPTDKGKLIYIGSSKNVKARVLSSNHPYMVAHRMLPDKYVYTVSMETEDYLQAEKELIIYYQPILNIQNVSLEARTMKFIELLK